MTSTKATAPGKEGIAPYTFLFAPFATDGGAGFGGQAVGSWMQMTGLLLGKLSEIQQDELRFLAMRLERDMQHQGNMAGCRSPSEAAETLSAFMRTMVEDYADNGRRLADAAGELQAAFLKFGGGGQAGAKAWAGTGAGAAPGTVRPAAE